MGCLRSSGVEGTRAARCGRIFRIRGRRRTHAADERPSTTYLLPVSDLCVNATVKDEGKISITAKVGPDQAGMVTLENYDALPAMLSGVQSKAVNITPEEHG